MDTAADAPSCMLHWQEFSQAGAGREVVVAPRTRWKRELLFWIGQGAFWGLNLVLQYLVFLPLLAPTVTPASGRALVITRFGTGLLVTLVLRSVYDWLSQTDWPIRRAILTAAAAIPLAAGLELALFRAILIRLVEPEVSVTYQGLLSFQLPLIYRMQVLAIWSLCFMGFFQSHKVRDAEVRAAQAESALRTSELDRLESHLQPHFLFNALTAVLACRHNPDAVARVTTGLSEYLRFTLSRQSTMEPFSRELEGLEHLLVVQRVRFGETLDCRIRCDARAPGVLVPSMLVGPLLDNALKYGAQTTSGKLWIEVDCRVEDETSRVTVSNNGSWIPPGSTGRRGTGLQNLRDRLDLLGMQGASLQCSQADDQVRVRVTIPLTGTRQRSEPDGRTTAAGVGRVGKSLAV